MNNYDYDDNDYGSAYRAGGYNARPDYWSAYRAGGYNVWHDDDDYCDPESPLVKKFKEEFDAVMNAILDKLKA